MYNIIDKTNQLKMMKLWITPRNIYIFHMLVVAPLLMYVGYNGPNTDPNIFTALMALATLVFLYHSYRLSQLMKQQDK